MLKQRSLLLCLCAAACAAPLLALAWPKLADGFAPDAPSLDAWRLGLDLGLALLAVLAWRLNQNRLAVVAGGLAASAAFTLAAAASGRPNADIADAWLAAVPSGLGLSLLPKEGSLFSGRTFGRAALLLLPAGLAWAVAGSDPADTARILAWRLLGPAGAGLSHAAALSLLLFAGALALRLHSRIEAALLALAGSLLGLTALAWALDAASVPPALAARFWLAGHLAQAACLGLGLFLLYWQRVYLDELTAVPNRRALDERLSHLSGDYSLAMVDIDHFKKFNDTYGHAQGDDVLRMVALHLKEGTRGRAYRYGGEEFCVLAPDLDGPGLEALMDGVRADLAARRFHIRVAATQRKASGPKRRGVEPDRSVQVQVTVSVGVARRDRKRETPALVLKLADEGLYAAKAAGRNAVVRKN